MNVWYPKVSPTDTSLLGNRKLHFVGAVTGIAGLVTERVVLTACVGVSLVIANGDMGEPTSRFHPPLLDHPANAKPGFSKSSLNTSFVT